LLATRSLWALVAGLLALYLFVFSLSAAGRLVRPLEELVYGESWLLDDARRVVNGEPLYGSPHQLPLVHTAYMPVYYVLVGQVQRLVGDHGYTVGRAVSLLATFGGAGALAWSVRRLTGAWRFGLLGAGLFLTQNLTVLLWAPLQRADALALGLSLGGLALVTAGRPLLAVVPFLLAVLTKQTFVVAPLVTFLALTPSVSHAWRSPRWPTRPRLGMRGPLTTGRAWSTMSTLTAWHGLRRNVECWRVPLAFASLFGGGVLLAVAAGQWLTNGWFLWHVVVANSNQVDFDTFARLMGGFLQYNGLPVVVALASLALPACPGERVWRLYLLGTLVTLPTIAKIGASSNYWLEISAVSAALLALASHHLAGRCETSLIAPSVLAGALFIAVPGYQATSREALDSLRDYFQPPAMPYLSLVNDVGTAPYRVERSFVQRITREPGELLTDNSGLAAAAGKRIEYEFQIFQLLRAEGRWSEQPILDAIRARRFALVALMHPLEGPVGPRWTPAIREALLANYAADGQQSGFWLYRPKA
jgi:hypothetical protein